MKTASNPSLPPLHQRNWFRFSLITLGALPGLYVLVAYIALPALWKHYERNPQLEYSSKMTQTSEGIPGDPLNIGLVGSKTEVVQALLAAGWYPADPITLKSSLGIARSVLQKRSYPTAPVSTLYFEGRKQDFAFELPVGSSAKQRHHLRLWQSNNLSNNGRPFWIGSATFDSRIELSHYTGQITHHIDADIDRERDILVQTLEQAHQVESLYQVTGVGATVQGRNGGGDWYYTDGELTVGVLSVNNLAQPNAPTQVPNPALVRIKNRVWSGLSRWVK